MDEKKEQEFVIKASLENGKVKIQFGEYSLPMVNFVSKMIDLEIMDNILKIQAENDMKAIKVETKIPSSIITKLR